MTPKRFYRESQSEGHVSLLLPQPVIVINKFTDLNHQDPRTSIHPYHLLTLRISGQGDYWNENMKLPSEGPFIHLLPSGQKDTNGIVGNIENWIVLFRWPGMTFESQEHDRLKLHNQTTMLHTIRCKRLDGESMSPFISLFSTMNSAMQLNRPSGKILASNTLLSLLINFIELQSDQLNRVIPKNLSVFKSLLDDHIYDTTPIESLAKTCGASTGYLRRSFKHRYGISPQTYRNNQRLIRAKDLLIHSELNVSQVARKVGFDDPLYFSRMFSKFYDLSPRELVKKFR